MADKETIVEIAEEEAPVTEVAESEEVISEEEIQPEQPEVQTAEEPEEEKQHAETAEVYVTHTVRTEESISTYDNETDEQTCQVVETRTTVSGPASSSSQTIAECGETDNDEDDKEDKEVVDAESEHVPETDQLAMIAELKESIKALASELATLKESISHREEVAEESEPETVTAETKIENKWTLVNPFMSTISVPSNKYSLLEKA